MSKFHVGDPVSYKTDKAYKYRGLRFRVIEVRRNGDVVIGSVGWKPEEGIVVDKNCLHCLEIVSPPYNKAEWDY